MKKFIFALILLPATLCSCKENKYKNYTVSKGVYEHELNAHTVLFESNYRIDIEGQFISQSSEFDNGYARVDATQIYYFEDLGNDIRCSHYNSGGVIDYTTTNSEENICLWWFGNFYYLFKIPYEAFEFDKQERQYVCGEVNYSEEFGINRGIIRAYKNKPMYFEFDIKGFGTYKATFSQHGNISIKV